MKMLIFLFSLLGSGFVYAGSLDDHLSEKEVVLEDHLSETEAKEKVIAENQEDYYGSSPTAVYHSICYDPYMYETNSTKVDERACMFLIYE